MTKKNQPIPALIWKNPLYFIAFGFGSGALPYAPGTWGTLFAIPFYLAIRDTSLWIYLLITLIAMAGSMWLCDKISRDIHIHDHPGMCIDEFVGFLVTMIGVPKGWLWIIAGFLLFRLFDIWKPFPINYIDKKVPGGIGMVLDDVVAGLFACFILLVLNILLR